MKARRQLYPNRRKCTLIATATATEMSCRRHVNRWLTRPRNILIRPAVYKNLDTTVLDLIFVKFGILQLRWANISLLRYATFKVPTK